MKTQSNPLFWMDVATVMTFRVTTLPMMWVMNPGGAAKETRQMFSEKEDALRVLQQQVLLAPMMFLCDTWNGAVKGDTDLGMNRARQSAERRLSQPYTSRVTANRKRLSRR